MPKLIVDNDIQTENMSDEFMITKEFKNSACKNGEALL